MEEIREMGLPPGEEPRGPWEWFVEELEVEGSEPLGVTKELALFGQLGLPEEFGELDARSEEVVEKRFSQAWGMGVVGERLRSRRLRF